MGTEVPAARQEPRLLHDPNVVCPDCKITWHLDKTPYYWTRERPCPMQLKEWGK